MPKSQRNNYKFNPNEGYKDREKRLLLRNFKLRLPDLNNDKNTKESVTYYCDATKGSQKNTVSGRINGIDSSEGCIESSILKTDDEVRKWISARKGHKFIRVKADIWCKRTGEPGINFTLGHRYYDVFQHSK